MEITIATMINIMIWEKYQIRNPDSPIIRRMKNNLYRAYKSDMLAFYLANLQVFYRKVKRKVCFNFLPVSTVCMLPFLAHDIIPGAGKVPFTDGCCIIFFCPAKPFCTQFMRIDPITCITSDFLHDIFQALFAIQPEQAVDMVNPAIDDANLNFFFLCSLLEVFQEILPGTV
jgi:hypothetical protein